MKAQNVRANARQQSRSFVTLKTRRASSVRRTTLHHSAKIIAKRSRRGGGFLSTCAHVLAGAMFAWVAVASFDMAPNASADAPIATNLTAAPTGAPLVSMIDIDADGKADFANPTNTFVRGTDGYGSGMFGAHRDGVRGGRKHHGADYVAAAGAIVRAPINGVVTRIGYAYRRNVSLRFIELRDETTRQSARVFYVAPDVSVGDDVSAGDQIGLVQSLQRRYPGITNHVHVEIDDARGRAIDPETVLPAPVTTYAAGARPVQAAYRAPS